MTAPGGEAARWDSEAQRWADGRPPPTAYTGPTPPRPTSAPAPTSAPGPGPVTDMPLSPEPSGPVRNGRTRALVAGATVAVLAAGAGGSYALWGGRGDDRAAARASHRATAPASGTDAGTAPGTEVATTTSAATEVPDGFRLVQDEADFTLAVPGDWERTERSNGVFYTSPDESGLVQIMQVADPDSTPHQSLEATSRELAGSAANPRYEEISLGAMADPAPAADAVQLVYAYDSEKVGERVKVVDCAFTADDGRQFAVLVRGTESEWPRQEEIQRIALGTFAPTG
ncbi:hypothetical protein [Streptomyces sp. NPDC048650]|uniref:hypothetical protein n=1 Tax=Streptomyces sp. NPDC048650 TaxID=3365583 RepID=UPI00371E7B5D